MPKALSNPWRWGNQHRGPANVMRRCCRPLKSFPLIRLVVPLQVVEWIPNFYLKSQRLSQSTLWRRQAACRAVGTGGRLYRNIQVPGVCAAVNQLNTLAHDAPAHARFGDRNEKGHSSGSLNLTLPHNACMCTRPAKNSRLPLGDPTHAPHQQMQREQYSCSTASWISH